MLLMTSVQAGAQSFETATDAVKNMGVGWNLGNTLDANEQSICDITNDGYWGQQNLNSETCWGQPKTTQELIKMMKEAGFTAIRVPVTWYNHMDKDGNVNADWMARVKEVVDYVIDEGLYCIVNVHHDTGADSKDKNGNLTGYHWIKADADNYTNNKDRFVYLWQQIAETFKSYDQKLLFEGYNEMLDANSCWNYPTWFQDGKNYDANYAAKSFKAINDYAQTFVNTVRGTGGNNSKRNLIVNTYAACAGGNWGHVDEVVKQMKLPTETTKGHLIFEVHSYPNISNLNTAKSDFKNVVKSLKDNLVAQGAPVIFGEWGTSNVDNGKDYIERREDMISFLDFFVKTCKQNDMATFYWMGLSDGQYRSQLVFNQADLAKTITKAYHGSSFDGKYPEPETGDGVLFEGEQMLEWGTCLEFAGAIFANLDNSAKLEITYQQKYDQFSGDDAYGMFQFWSGGWGSKIDVIVDGKTYKDGDFNPASVYETPDGTEHTTQFSFSPTIFNTIKAKGVLFQGHGILVKKVVLVTGETGIGKVLFDAAGDNGFYYNLNGQRVSTPKKGIYIKNGKKYIQK
jgi:hypothetical protein